MYLKIQLVNSEKKWAQTSLLLALVAVEQLPPRCLSSAAPPLPFLDASLKPKQGYLQLRTQLTHTPGASCHKSSLTRVQLLYNAFHMQYMVQKLNSNMPILITD